MTLNPRLCFGSPLTTSPAACRRSIWIRRVGFDSSLIAPDLSFALFAQTYQPYRFSEIIVFFSHNKSASSSVVLPARRMGHLFRNSNLQARFHFSLVNWTSLLAYFYYFFMKNCSHAFVDKNQLDHQSKMSDYLYSLHP
jgi:hypothetical protein